MGHTVKAVTLIFIYGRDSVILSTQEGKSGSFHNFVLGLIRIFDTDEQADP